MILKKFSIFATLGVTGKIVNQKFLVLMQIYNIFCKINFFYFLHCKFITQLSYCSPFGRLVPTLVSCKIFFGLFLCYSILSIFFIILLFFAYSSYIHNGNCHQFLVYLELVQEYYVHVFHKFPCCGDKVINESKTLDNG